MSNRKYSQTLQRVNMLTIFQTINHWHSIRHARKKVLSSASGTSAMRLDGAGAWAPALAELQPTSAMRLDAGTWAPALPELPPV